MWFAFFRNDSPPPASLSTATQGITVGSATPTTAKTTASTSATGSSGSSGSSGSTSGAAGASTTTAAASSPSAGTWTVNSTVTSSSGGNFGGFRIEEVLSNVGTTTAVGRSTGVTGSLTFDGATLVNGSFTVDMTKLATDKAQRDSRMKSALETSTFGTATFTVKGPVSLGATPTEGATLSIDVPGTFTIHGVTKDATVHVEATVTNGVLTIVGTAPFALAEYDITAPTAPVVVSIEDHGTIELQLYLTPS